VQRIILKKKKKRRLWSVKEKGLGKTFLFGGTTSAECKTLWGRERGLRGFQKGLVGDGEVKILNKKGPDVNERRGGGDLESGEGRLPHSS